MKIFVCTLLYFCIVITFACDETKKFDTPATKIQTKSTRNLQSNFEESILEVTSDFVGMMWMTGKVIDFRLFENGTVEYDAYPKTSSTQLKAEEVKTLQRMEIRAEQTKEFIDFLTNKEFLSAKNKYTKENCFAHDAKRNIEIKFKYKNTQKQISVIHNCEVIPEPISRLLEKIEKITNQPPV